jgi:hypothetical protein
MQEVQQTAGGRLRLQQRVELWWTSAENHIEAHPYLWVTALATVTLFLLGVEARFRPLQYEEIVTYCVTRAPDLGTLYANLKKGIDNHAPLDYSLRYLSMALFGDYPLSFRLPSLAGFAVGVFAVFGLVRRHASAISALLAALLFAASQAAAVGQYARSYGMVLGNCALGLWLWRKAADGKSRGFTVPLLAVSMVASLMLHYYGPLQMLCVVAAELMRTVQRRRIDWWLWPAFAATFLPLPLVWPLIRNARMYSKGFWAPLTVEACLEIYHLLFAYLAAPVVIILFLYVVVLAVTGQPENASPAPSRQAAPELAAAGWLVALPVIIFVVAKAFTGALFFRYAVSLIVGVTFVFGLAVSYSRALRMVAAVVLSVFALALLAAKASSFARHTNYGLAQEMRVLAGMTDAPIVIDSPQSFLESWYYAPDSLRKRIYYLVDADAAYRIQKQNVDQRFLLIMGGIAGFQAVPREEFIREHPRFALVYEGGWLLDSIATRVRRIEIAYYHRIPLMTIEQAAESR